MVYIIILSVIVAFSAGLIIYTVCSTSPKRNKDWETKIKEMSAIFNEASDHISITTDLDTEFFGDRRVTDSLEKAAENGAKIRIVYDPKGYRLNDEKLSGLRKLIRAKRIQARKAKKAFTKETVRHVMEIDGERTRLETFHPAKQMIEAKANARIYQSPVVAYLAEEEFDKIWKGSARKRVNGSRD